MRQIKKKLDVTIIMEGYGKGPVRQGTTSRGNHVLNVLAKFNKLVTSIPSIISINT